MGRFNASSERLQDLCAAVTNQGEEYIANIEKLNSLSDAIIGGSIDGKPAKVFKDKYEDLRPILNAIKDELEKAQDFAKQELNDFNNLVEELGN